MSESESRYASPYSDSEIQDHIQRLADGERPPTMQELNADEQAPTESAIMAHFGKWSNAVKAAGFEPRENGPNAHPNRISRGELIGWLQAFKLEFGVWPRVNDIREWPGPTQKPYLREFGAWSDAIAAAKEGMDDA